MTSAELTSIDANPAPPGAEVRTINNGDVELRVARWRPEGAKGTVILTHGRTEFIEKYFEVIGELLARGYAVFTFDWRGQGLSTRELGEWQRGHVFAYEDYLQDLDCIFADPFFTEMPGPRRLISHSMGCNIMFRYLQAHPDLVARAVFTGPMLDIGSGFQKPLMRLFSKAALALGKGPEEPFFSKPVDPAQEPFETQGVTSDPVRFERTKKVIAANPRLGVSGLSWDWISASLQSVEVTWTEEFQTQVTVPTLIVAAGREVVVDASAATRCAVACAPVEVVTIGNAKHEIMMERDPVRAQFHALAEEFFGRD